MIEYLEDNIKSVRGFRVAGVHCGLKPDDKLDFALIVSQTPCVAAGVFTTNQVKAAPVLVDQAKLAKTQTGYRAVAINTGSANACTGQQGIDNAHQTARWVAEAIGCSEAEVLVLSTGVIGTQLPMENIRNGIELAAHSLGDNWEAAARAIMTTDTRPKMASQAIMEFSGASYGVAGISKGAGMIAPNMATMLGVIVTEAGVSGPVLQRCLSNVVSGTFNRIVVDGDMSTNDTVLLLANGASGNLIERPEASGEFAMVLNHVSKELAKDVVRDGEGATKFITIQITGAPDDASARRIADAIATSPLVKTAFYGGDANWGRIVAAAGRAGIPLAAEQLRLWIAPGEKGIGKWVMPKIAPGQTVIKGWEVKPRFLSAPDETTSGLQLFLGGVPSNYPEEQAAAIMRESSIAILLDCGLAEGWAEVWTCDLSHDYVSINGHYRT